MLRSLLASALVILISMTLQVPFLTISLIVVFYVTQANVVLTRLVGIMFVVGSTLGITVAILLLKFTFDEPFLRILAATALFATCVFLMRVTKIGVTFFIVAIVVIYAQSFVDMTSEAELLVRLILWAWVAACYAVAVTLVINTVLLPAEPVAQLKAEMLRLIRLATEMLAQHPRGLPFHAVSPEPHLAAATLLKLLRFATIRNTAYRLNEGIHLARIAAISRLYADSRELAENAQRDIGQEMRNELHQAYVALAAAITNDKPYSFELRDKPEACTIHNAVIASIQLNLKTLASLDSNPSSEPFSRENEGLFLPDAFSNPVYVQFALKTTLAALIGYVFYTGVQWDGIHTVMLTCLIVSQPGLGNTSRRSLLRVIGAVVASALALFMVVFVVPHLDDIVGLLAIILPVIALGAWIAAGPEDISYAGTQLMFTYALALLGTFGPPTDITEIRDRIIGILLGVVLSILIHSTIAPETEGEPLRQRLAGLIHSLAELLRLSVGPEPQQTAIVSRQILATWNNYSECESLLARFTLEPDWQLGGCDNEQLTLYTQQVLRQLNTILRTASSFKNTLASHLENLPTAIQESLLSLESELAATLDKYANMLIQRPTDTSSPPLLAFNSPTATHGLDNTDGLNKAGILPLIADLTHQVAALPSWNKASTVSLSSLPSKS